MTPAHRLFRTRGDITGAKASAVSSRCPARRSTSRRSNHEYIAEGERVIVLGRMRATVKATGRPYDNEWAMAYRFENGKIANFQVYEDTARELEAHTE
jgi:hypothetical protein